MNYKFNLEKYAITRVEKTHFRKQFEKHGFKNLIVLARNNSLKQGGFKSVFDVFPG